MTIAVFTFSLLGAMALGMPIAFALIVCGVALMHWLDIFDSQIVAQNIINGADSFPLMAVPFFMLAGEVMNRGGLAARIVNVALALVGHIKGGLGYVTILASCVLASLSGSAGADAACDHHRRPAVRRVHADRSRRCRRRLRAVRRDLHLSRTEDQRALRSLRLGCAQHQRRHVPGGRGAGLVLADHGVRNRHPD